MWLRVKPIEQLAERVPGTDNVVGEEKPAAVEGDVFAGVLAKSGGVPANIPGSWPQFRGKNFDAINDENVSLAKKWAEGEPKILWGIDVGEGYAGAAIFDVALDGDPAQGHGLGRWSEQQHKQRRGKPSAIDSLRHDASPKGGWGTAFRGGRCPGSTTQIMNGAKGQRKRVAAAGGRFLSSPPAFSHFHDQGEECLVHRPRLGRKWNHKPW